MNISELNEYIKNYIEKDKTKSAIMLTAPWGTGKSFYVENNLKKFLNKNNKKRCIIISLYGLKEIEEVSKSIYIELRANKWFTQKNEIITGGIIIGKTIIKNLAGLFNISFKQSKNDIERLYSSINLTDKLIVLDDLERTNIDIREIFGFVNNLVEHDGCKVLLVANEDEIKSNVKAKTGNNEILCILKILIFNP